MPLVLMKNSGGLHVIIDRVNAFFWRFAPNDASSVKHYFKEVD